MPKKRNSAITLFLFLFLFFTIILAGFPSISQGIKGRVSSVKGEDLPFATIYLPKLNLGASTNINGQYEIKLSPGTYQVQVQYIGYETVKAQLIVKNGWMVHDFVLPEQTLLLDEVKVQSRQEDPAYTIMRKAISKRKYHLLQYDSYFVKVYTKGTGELKKAPFFLRKKIEEEGGVKLNEAYTTESVSELTFKQPNTIEEKVISVRTTGEEIEGATPSVFIKANFYEDQVANVISPLAGSAFAYYKFSYQGSFMEGGHEINKIRVSPRSKGEQVFDGYIYIIENDWAIHSLDLKTNLMGFQVKLQMNYAEVAKSVWLPVTYRLNFSGKAFGFAGEFRFLASLSNYEVDINEDLVAETEIIDEKIQVVPRNLPEIRVKDKEKEEVAALLESEDKMTRKQFRKMIDQYEKEAIKESESPRVISETSFKIDSLAAKRDSVYWANIRPVPLTVKEIKGYERDDSVARVNAAKITGVDTTNSIKKGKFKVTDLVLGGNYNFSPRLSYELKPLVFHTFFNTVEGLNVNLVNEFKYEFDSLRKTIQFMPVFRYGFSSEEFYALGQLSYESKKKEKSIRLNLEGGKFVDQYSDKQPIHPHINTFSTLLFRRNYMKLYEKSYIKLQTLLKPSDWWEIDGGLEFAQRNTLSNQNDYSLLYEKSREFKPNQPFNLELSDTDFPEHEALLFNLNLSYWPLKRYRIYNGRRFPLKSDSPKLLLNYKKGISGILGSDVDFDHLALGIDHQFNFGVSGKLQFELRGGTFLNNSKMTFVDYQHFEGNRTIFSSIKPAGAFRLLDYYAFSTNSTYFSAHTHYQFRKFLLTQLPELRFSGMRENIFINYLKHENSPHYYELGYSLDQVFRILRIEVAASFMDREYREVGLRIGVSTLIQFGGDSDKVTVY